MSGEFPELGHGDRLSSERPQVTDPLSSEPSSLQPENEENHRPELVGNMESSPQAN
jgi:hypothetical protein